jgi:hypothetical protein
MSLFGGKATSAGACEPAFATAPVSVFARAGLRTDVKGAEVSRFGGDTAAKGGLRFNVWLCDTAARGGLRFDVSRRHGCERRPTFQRFAATKRSQVGSRRWPAAGRPPRSPEGLRRTVTGRSIRPGITARKLRLSANSESATNQACDMGKSALLRGLDAQLVVYMSNMKNPEGTSVGVGWAGHDEATYGCLFLQAAR